jgi:hypothetical protein
MRRFGGDRHGWLFLRDLICSRNGKASSCRNQLVLCPVFFEIV